MAAFSAAAREWHDLLLRDVDEAFVDRHLDSAMQLAVALHCQENAKAECVVESISNDDQQGFLALSIVLRRLIEVAMRKHMKFLLPTFTNDELTASPSLNMKLAKQQELIQSLPSAFQLRFRQLLQVHWDALTYAAQKLTFSMPGVQQLHWQVATDNKSEKRILLRLQTSDRKTRTICVPMQQFHQLRHSAATVLQEMNEVEVHPMMRLVYMERSFLA